MENETYEDIISKDGLAPHRKACADLLEKTISLQNDKDSLSLFRNTPIHEDVEEYRDILSVITHLAINLQHKIELAMENEDIIRKFLEEEERG